MDLTYVLQLLKQYGPVVGLLLAFIIWQSTQINRLLNKVTGVYDAEIERMAKVQDELLKHILGQQASSIQSPSVEDMKKMIPPPKKEE